VINKIKNNILFYTKLFLIKIFKQIKIIFMKKIRNFSLINFKVYFKNILN
jgi:hypothetical protein